MGIKKLEEEACKFKEPEITANTSNTNEDTNDHNEVNENIKYRYHKYT